MSLRIAIIGAGMAGVSAGRLHKAGRIGAGCTVMVAQMSEAFSRRHLESPPTDYPGLVRSMVERRWRLSSENFLAALGHRWRYARVEDAWLAGRDTARKIIESHSNH
jgi:predicted NAD/FAD-dependent oxidoreductase